MTNANDARRAHEVLDGLFAGRILSRENEQLLRNFLPERPKQKTLEEIIAHVDDAWSVASDNDWGGNSYDPDVSIEDWLTEMHTQLKGLTLAKPARPEFLETEADYRNAPGGTIAAIENAATAWIKKNDWWLNTDGDGRTDGLSLRGVPRKVLRWGDGK